MRASPDTTTSPSGAAVASPEQRELEALRGEAAEAVPARRYEIKLPLGNRKMDAIAFPGRKIAMFDHIIRHQTKQDTFYAYEDVKQPMLFWDTHVSMETKVNVGFRPNQPVSRAATLIRYEPEPWEPPTRSGRASDPVRGWYRWTRGGLRGVDFGGTEVNTGQR